MINLAAAFDTRMMREVAENIGSETRVLGFNMLLAPMPTIARVPHGGRAFECFGEDPYLAARMTGSDFDKGAPGFCSFPGPSSFTVTVFSTRFPVVASCS